MRAMACARAIVIAALAGLGLVASAAPAAALVDPPDQVVLTGSVVVPRGVEAGEVVVLRGSARVDGIVRGDVVVVDGPIVVHGQVSGSVIAVDGRVVLGSSAQVNGDVSSRGTIAAAEGAAVGGRIRQHVAFAWRTPTDVFGRFASWLAVSISTLLFGLLLVLFAPRALDAASAVARASPWPSAGWGVGIAVGLPLAVILSLASLVALPLGLVTLLGIGLLAFFGYVVSAYALGRAVRPSPGNRAFALGAGWLILRAVAAIPVVSGITFGLTAAYGLGAAGVAMWRARATTGRHRGRRRPTQVTASPETAPPAPAPVAAPFGEEAGL
jgi:cytoskeletal protein CcmA (bactofilin family)